MRNQETLDNLVLYLEGNCADLLDAARRAGISLQFLNQWRKDDPETDRIITEACQNGVQGLLSEATRRAVHGIEKGVYYKGVLVDTQQEYSDSLLTTLLKARVPEFRDTEAQRGAVTVNIANLMPRASNYEEWLAMKGSTASRSLPAPDPADTQDAEFIEAVEYVMRDPATDEAHEVFKGIDL